jgi:hypothetical protein
MHRPDSPTFSRSRGTDETARRMAAMELDTAPAGNRANRMIPETRMLARASRTGRSKAMTFVPRRKGRPVLTQIRKNHRIVGSDNLDPHEHVAVEPDLAREVSPQRVGDFVVMGLMRRAMNS